MCSGVGSFESMFFAASFSADWSLRALPAGLSGDPSILARSRVASPPDSAPAALPSATGSPLWEAGAPGACGTGRAGAGPPAARLSFP